MSGPHLRMQVKAAARWVDYLLADIADEVINNLRGAMKELSIGDPALLTTDIGPLIDAEATQKLASAASADSNTGHCVSPEAFEIGRVSNLAPKIFRPI